MAFRGQIRDLYEFGPFRLDATERTLTRDGASVPLPPKVFDTLLVLVENSGTVLAKDELLRTIWPDSFVEESNLAQNISQLRKALGESAAGQRFIETIPKRGYRFVADVKKIKSHAPEFAALQRADANLFLEDEINEPSVFDEDDAEEARRPALAALRLTPPVEQPAIQKVTSRRRLILPAAAAAAVIVALVAYFLMQRQSAARLTFQQMRMTKLTSSGKARMPAISPDGKYVAYVQDDAGNQSLWVRQVAAASSVQITPAMETPFHGVSFAPDGNFVYYVVQEKGQNPGLIFSTLYRVPLLGGTPEKVLHDVDSGVTFSPDGRQIAFVRHYPAKKESAIVTANADGTNERNVSVRPQPKWYTAVGPSWSPDGRLIACAVASKGTHGAQTGVALVNVADGKEELIGPQTLAWVGQVAWLADGSGVAVNAWHKETAAYADQLWLLSYPGGALSRMTNDLMSYTGLSAARAANAMVTARSDRMVRMWLVKDGDTENAEPSRSHFSDSFSEQLGLDWPVPNRLLYASHASGNLDIWAMDADGANQRQLTLDSHTDVSPVGTRDGRYVVFMSERAGTPNIWRADADGSNPKQLTFGSGEGTPSLSPDGRWVVYTSRGEDEPRLWKVSIDGGTPVQLSKKTLSLPMVSPDGKWILCYYRDDGLKIHPALLPFEGGEEVKIIDLRFPVWGLIEWTADSRALSYIRNEDGVSNIWALPIDGGAPKQLTHFKTDQIFRFAWSPDGQQLACERGVTVNDIVLISDFK